MTVDNFTTLLAALTALIVSVGSVGGTFLAWRKLRKDADARADVAKADKAARETEAAKMRGEITRQVQQQAIEWGNRQQERIDELGEDNKELRDRVDGLEQEVSALKEERAAQSSVIDASMRQIASQQQRIKRLELSDVEKTSKIQVLEASESLWKSYSQELLRGIKLLIKQVLVLGDNRVMLAYDPPSPGDFAAEQDKS